MKIRKGFVSNSSSSSFIVSTSSYENVFELSEEMIRQVNYKPQVNEVLDRLKNSEKDPNTPVMFYSCNYNTYISKYYDYYLVDTCNNEDWQIETGFGSLKDPKYSDIIEQYGELDFTKIHDDLKFWDLENNHMFKKQHGWISCERKDSNGSKLCGYSEMVIINDELQCPYCYHLQNGKPSRYLLYKERDKKLERIITNNDYETI